MITVLKSLNPWVWLRSMQSVGQWQLDEHCIFSKEKKCLLGSDYVCWHGTCCQQYKNKHGEFDCEIRMIVHQSQAGCIIGRAGFKVKELREVSVCLVLMSTVRKFVCERVCVYVYVCMSLWVCVSDCVCVLQILKSVSFELWEYVSKGPEYCFFR